MHAFQGGMGKFAAHLVKLVSQHQGLEEARRIYKQLLQLPPPGGKFFHAILDLENDQTDHKLKDSELVPIFEVKHC